MQERAAILWCAVWRVPQALVPAMIRGVGREVVKNVYNDWRAALAEFMQEAQEHIKFGNFPSPGNRGGNG